MEFSTIKGFKDILPDEVGNWQQLEKKARRLFHVFGFNEIKTPVLERTELFSRGIGQETDIVSKEMYTIPDSKGRGQTLRPEATASVVRAYIQHRLYQKYPVQKLFSIGPMFRHERPQRGRYRQFHQINAEFIGDPGPKSDADLIILCMSLINNLGLNELKLQINSLGCLKCRPLFQHELQDNLAQKEDALCEDCLRRSKTNPLRVFDCKVEGCRQIVSKAPTISDFLCAECLDHFNALKSYMNDVKVPFAIDHSLVRGLDYYTRTTFEIQTEHLGAQNAVAGGGRYDGLVKLLGGPDHPAIGFAIGMERIIALISEQHDKTKINRPNLFIAAIGEKAEIETFQWVMKLRKAGFWVEIDYAAKGLKSQMKKAGRLAVKKVLIVGDDEIATGKAILRDMDTKNQDEVDLQDIINKLKELLL